MNRSVWLAAAETIYREYGGVINTRVLVEALGEDDDADFPIVAITPHFCAAEEGAAFLPVSVRF